ncbi:MAG: hypothetical protein HZA78_03875 [Candidatus Schekmanbacteria bacterium]|nr:hypothetical protein [Candidatus Schekmanbacteria bacterium]
MKIIAMISLIAFVNFVLAAGYPAEIQAGESLTISGFGIKTAAFKPYMEEGQIAFFMNKAAAVNVELQDKDFNLVRSLAFMGKGKEGENFIAWNGRHEQGKNTIVYTGRDDQGEFVKSGRYIFSVTAMAEDGTSAIISKEVEIEFAAPKGIEFKPHVTEIEGKAKKMYPSEEPTKITMEDGYTRTCIGGPFFCLPLATAGWLIVATIGIIPLLVGNESDRTFAKDVWSAPFKAKTWKEIFDLKTVPDPEEYAKIKQEIDEDNAELAAEIAKRNREIDEDNLTIVVKMKVVD